MTGFRALFLLSLTFGAAHAQTSDAVTFAGAGLGRTVRIDPDRARDGVFFQLEPSDRIDEPFDAIVFHGEMPDAAVVFEVSRTEGPGEEWSAWREAAVHRRKDGRFWARTRFAEPRAGLVRLRARNGGVRDAHTLVLYEMDAAAPAGGGAEASLSGGSAGPSTRPEGLAQDQPPIVSREEWGARPPKNPFRPHQPVRMTQHHTAGRQPRTLEESLAEIRFIQEYHQEARGFDDIGYHFLLDAEGRIFQGRPVTAVGAHVKGFNTGNVGISFMGYHHPPFDHPVTPAQLESLRLLGRWLISEFAVPAGSYLGHRDLAASDCPGDGLYRLLPAVRESFGRESPQRAVSRRELPAAPLYDGSR